MKNNQVLLLPGWGMAPRVFAELTKVLKAEYSLHPVDWQGCKTSNDFSHNCLPAGENKALLIPPIMVGWSLGGMVALELALRYPEKVQKLVLFGTTPRFTRDNSSSYWSGWPGGVLKRMKKNLQAGEPETQLQSFRQNMFTATEIGGGFLQKYENEGCVDQHLTMAELLGGLDYLGTTDLREQLPALKSKVLIIHGSADQIVPLTAAQYLAQSLKEQANFEIIPETGHLPFWTKPDLCQELMFNFIRDN